MQRIIPIEDSALSSQLTQQLAKAHFVTPYQMLMVSTLWARLVNISAVLSSGWQFFNWIGDVADADSHSTTMIMNSNKTATAIFTPRLGTVNVITNLSTATFSIAGSAEYRGSGTFWSQADVSAGQHTINYGDVNGYTKLASETKTLATGGYIAFTGNYSWRLGDANSDCITMLLISAV